MNLSPGDIEDILSVLDSTDYDELHLATDRFTLALRREAGGWTQEHEARSEPRMLVEDEEDVERPGAVEPSGSSAPGESGRTATPASRSAEGLTAVTAPLPGVFYRAPKPGAPPFVEVGGRVEQDTVVAILETMKLMSAVHAGAAGTIVEICIENNESVEQHAVLAWLEPDTTA